MADDIFDYILCFICLFFNAKALVLYHSNFVMIFPKNYL